MPSPEAIAQTVASYLELVATGTADQVIALYTADATVEDPIGSELLHGRDAIHGFYKNIEGAKKATELVELRAGAAEAAFLWHLTLDAGDNRTRISPISVMTFDEDAKITSMRAFWSPADVQVM
jgi:steroid Delta-isomerase